MPTKHTTGLHPEQYTSLLTLISATITWNPPATRDRKLTQEALANKANVSRSWLIGLEQGKRPRAEMDKILSLLGALDISLNLQTMQAHDSASEDQTPQDNSARSHHQQPSSHIPQATEKSADSASWDSRLGEVFKKLSLLTLA